MITLFTQYFPNVVKYQDLIIKATHETIVMVFFAGIYATLIGVPIGIILYNLGKNGIWENKYIYSIFSKAINILRSIPFIILISAIPWLIRILAGSPYGVKGSIVSLAIGTFPFMAKQVELALLQVDKGIIEAYESMGFSSLQIITKVILKEALPYIIQAITLTLISLISFSAVAGTIGGGGLGSFALQYGYNEFKDDIMIVTVVLILILVFTVQFIGDLLYKYFRKVK